MQSTIFRDGNLKRVLMIAYHFPPLAGSSGVQRTLRFVQHLPEMGWQPLVLSVAPRAYEKISDDLLSDVPPGTVVRRALALDAARHLAVAGRYFRSMALPDRWVSWKFDGIREGRKLIDEFKPDVIWSTSPIATAHVIAAALHRGSGIPWVADFRDPLGQPDYPPDVKIRETNFRIEAEVAAQATRCVFAAPSAARDFAARYKLADTSVAIVENGYDEDSFRSAQGLLADVREHDDSDSSTQPLLMLHSGIVYPSERNPTHLFVALGQLCKKGILGPDDLRIRFRASTHDELLRDLATRHGAMEFVELCPDLPYQQALAEMMIADVLLLMQASSCNSQIPAKFYEYLRAGKPILGLTDPVGDTAHALRAAGCSYVWRLDSVEQIAQALPSLVRALQQGVAELPYSSAIPQASRRSRTHALAGLFDSAAP